ncbi:MAG: hypothetical protein COZ05_07095 [Armatimonadetes bacterium CG_4_10_14_3_um_filter_59_10]|nr:MAG: hypothetical protein COZ56_00640 [Armatimonadetes bacterium CG_4_8_14_3_um_filter_58_9]PIY44889.1 MAG: hypothetical protein COZ05_07095 [Armatimonadetes bacterium CG_4_10_14_3_um_filter_59_10]
MEPMKVKLGCEPITWGDDFETAVKEIAEIGYRGIEPVMLGYEARTEELRALLDTYGLAATGAYLSCSFLDPDKMEAEITAATSLASRLPVVGCYRIVLASRTRMVDQVHEREVYERFADGCNETARRCFGDFGVETVFHNHAWTLVESPHEIDLLCEMTDPQLIGMGFDTAHLAYGGGNPAKVFRKHVDRVRYVHIKDLNPDLKRHRSIAAKNANRPEHVFVELGEGCIGDKGLVTVLNVLRKSDYHGWIISELDTTPRSPKEGNAMNYNWLMQHLTADELDDNENQQRERDDET